MDSKYFLGVPEIDGQHEQIIGLIGSLRAMAADSDQQHLIRRTLKDLYVLSVTHFAQEESFMKTIGCPDLPGHRAIHNEILDLLDEHLGGTTALGDVEYLSKLMSDRYLDHIVEHDLKMAEFVTQFVARFRTPPGAA